MSLKAQWLIVVSVAVIIGVSGFAYYYMSNQTSSPLSNSTSSTLVISGVNSSLSCSQFVSPPPYLIPSLSTVVSQLKNSSEFKALAQGRSFQYADYPGPGCSDNLLNSTITPGFDFSYQDTNHPYTKCGETAYPSYQITAEVYLVPQGYDLSRTQWHIWYYGPYNVTSTCTSAASNSVTSS
jgi:hypothetical protein